MAFQLSHGVRSRGCSRTRSGWAGVVGVAALLLISPLAVAEQGAVPAGDDVGLGRLLKLPDTYRIEAASRNRGTQEQWRSRFEEAAREVVDAEQHLRRVQDRMASMAGETSAYQMTAPGLGGGSGGTGTPAGSSDSESSPMSFSLREQTRQAKENLAQAKRNQRDLEVQANLAGIPESWRSAPDAKAPAGPSR